MEDEAKWCRSSMKFPLAIALLEWFYFSNVEIEFNIIEMVFTHYWHWKACYASPTSGEAYRDRQLTTNFELWVEIFCVPTCFHMRIPKPCLSVCPHPEKRYHHSFVNISPTLVIVSSMERSSRVLHHGNPKIWSFFQKSSKFVFWQRAEITLASSISVLHK